MVGGGGGGIDGGGGGGTDDEGAMLMTVLILLPPIGMPKSEDDGIGIDMPIGPMPNRSEDDGIGNAVTSLAPNAELLMAPADEFRVPEIGIKSSNAHSLELLVECMIGFFCCAVADTAGTTPANKPSAKCILRDLSASDSSSLIEP